MFHSSRLGVADTESFVTCRNFIAEIFYEHNLGNNLMKFQGLQSRAAFMETIDVLPRRRRQGFFENDFPTEAVTLVMQQLRQIRTTNLNLNPHEKTTRQV